MKVADANVGLEIDEPDSTNETGVMRVEYEIPEGYRLRRDPFAAPCECEWRDDW